MWDYGTLFFDYYIAFGLQNGRLLVYRAILCRKVLKDGKTDRASMQLVDPHHVHVHVLSFSLTSIMNNKSLHNTDYFHMCNQNIHNVSLCKQIKKDKAIKP